MIMLALLCNHRGGIPENTLDAIRESEQNGAVAIEVDLAFTKDGHPVLLHDSTVDRTSNGSGEIVTLKLEDVQQLDFGAHAGYVVMLMLKYIRLACLHAGYSLAVPRYPHFQRPWHSLTASICRCF